MLERRGVPEHKRGIVDIHFAFNNKKMLECLAKRARALKRANFKKLKKYDTKLDAIKEANFNEIRSPNTFYVTFEEASSSQALINCYSTPLKIGDHKIALKKAKDPSDILWENRGITKTKRIFRSICLLGILLPVVLFSVQMLFIASLTFKQYALF